MALRNRILSAIRATPEPAPAAAPADTGASRRAARILKPAALAAQPSPAQSAETANRQQDRRAAVLTRNAGATADALADDVGENNKRWAKRKLRNSVGTILFPGITVPYNCIIRDTSSTGARIEMIADKYNQDAATESVPNDFTLFITLDRMQVECQTMWRRGSKMGIRFTSPAQAMAAPPPRPPSKLKRT